MTFLGILLETALGRGKNTIGRELDVTVDFAEA